MYLDATQRGPKTALSDEELLQEIRTVLKASPFLGKGHRKVTARLAAKGIRVCKNPGAPADAGARTAGAGAARPSPRRPAPQRPDRAERPDGLWYVGGAIEIHSTDDTRLFLS